MVALLIWLVATIIFLTDSDLLVGALGDRVSHAERQLWLGAPLLYAPVALLLTPWRGWGVLVLLLVLGVHLVGNARWHRRLLGQLRPAPPALTAYVAAQAARWGARPPSQVLVGNGFGPAVVGLRRSILVLPESALALSEQDLAAVVAHELAHVTHRDPVKQWLVGVAGTLLCWLPIARPVLEKLPLEIELAADRRAAEWLGDARGYALILGRLGLQSAGVVHGVSLTGRPAHLVVRLRTLVEGGALAHLYMPKWLPGRLREQVAADSAERASRPVPRYFGYWLVGGLTAGYLSLTGALIHWLG